MAMDPSRRCWMPTAASNGVTWQGGANGYGTIFYVTPEGSLTTLHNFDFTGGSYPDSTLLQANDGIIYGTTQMGGLFDYGTLFQMKPEWVLTAIYNCNTLYGDDPSGGLIQATVPTAVCFKAPGVSFNGTEAPFTVISPTQIRTAVPPGSSSGWVQVTTAGGTLATSPGFVFRIGQ